MQPLNWITLRHKAAWFAWVVAIWLIVAVIISVQGYVSNRVTGNPQPWLQVLTTTLPWYMSWAVLTPPIVWLASRFEFHFRNAGRFVAIHLSAGIAAAVCHALTYVAIASFLNRDNPHFPRSTDLIAIKLSGSIHVNLMIYALIVGLVVSGRAYAALRDREVAAAKLQKQLAEAQTAALRAQLQPHFLFNTLNAISGLVREDPTRAVRLIARLGDLLRLSIEDNRSQQSTLADEIAFTEAYLDIEVERLGERLKIVRDIAPEALSVNVPALVLQPLVENAVRHGIAPLVRGGTVTLRAAIEGEHLKLIVADNGSGAQTIREGIGLGNTRTRLRQLYGEQQSMTLKTSPDQGFEVVIKVPR